MALLRVCRCGGAGRLGFGQLDAATTAPSVEVVDAFIAARATRDLRMLAAIVPADATVVDTANSMAVRGDGWYQLLPFAEVLEVGPRHLEKTATSRGPNWCWTTVDRVGRTT